MKVSCLIATRNPNFNDLLRCFESIEKQVNQIVIIDDCSTNNNIRKALEKISNSELEVTYVRNKFNLGQTTSLIKGIRFCRFEFIARVDDDDYWSPTKIDKQLSLFKENKKIVLCGTSYRTIRDTKTLNSEKSVEISDFKNAFLKGNPFVHSSVIFKKSDYLKVGGYNEKIFESQDYDLWLRLYELGELAILNEILTVLKYQNRTSFKDLIKLHYMFFVEIKLKFCFIRKHKMHFIKYFIGFYYSLIILFKNYFLIFSNIFLLYKKISNKFLSNIS